MPATLLAEPQQRILSPREISELLETYDISIASWGKGTARSFLELVAYHENDQLSFRPENSQMMIDVNVVVVLVFYQSRSGWLELYEDYQEFPGGRILRRPGYDGIGETMKRFETPHEAAKRCLAEELNFHEPGLYQLSQSYEVKHRPVVPSEKWPGLLASYHRHIFECFITPSLFRRRGYVEVEGNRSVHFRWKRPNQMLLNI